MRRSLPSCPEPGFSGLPVFIAGCSLGGCIAVNAIHREGALFKGAALFAPMLSLERASQHGLNYYLRRVPLAVRGSKDVLHRSPRPLLHAQPACPARVLSRAPTSQAQLEVWCTQPPVSLKRARLLLRRPLASVLSRVAPSLPAASTTKNDLYPDLQALWDCGQHPSLLLQLHFLTSHPVQEHPQRL